MYRRTRTLLIALLLLPGSALLLLTPAEAASFNYEVTSIPFAPIALGTDAQRQNLGDNGVTGAIPMNLTTTFFGDVTDLFWIGANGFITMITRPSDTGCCEGGVIPDQTPPNDLVAGFWTDIDPTGGDIRFQTLPAPSGSGAAKVLVVSYTNVPLKSDPLSLQTFQFQVYDNGVYEVHWTKVDSQGQIATVGIESADGRRGLQAFREANFERQNQAVRFTRVAIPSPAPIVDSVSPAIARPGQTVSVLGANFDEASVVSLGGTPASTAFVSTLRLDVLVPTLPPGPVDVTVTNADGVNATLVAGLEVRPPLDPDRPTYFLSNATLRMLDLGPNATTLTLSDETLSDELPIGFTVPFFGENVSTYWVASNGFLAFVTPPGTLGPNERHPFPDPREPNALLAGFWDDLDPGLGGTVRVATIAAPPDTGAGQVLVAEWRDVPLFGTPSATQRFQVHVYDDGVLEIHLERATTDGRLAIVGVEDVLGDTGVNAFVGTNRLLLATAFRLTPGIGVPPPVVASIAPTSGPVGTEVEIIGSNFAEGATVRVGNVTTTSTFVDAGLLRTAVPSLPEGPADVAVTNPDDQTAFLAGAFLVTSSPAPSGLAIAFASPAEGRAGDAFTAFGQGFQPGARLFLDGRALATTFVTTTSLRATVPSGLTGGAATLRVVNPDGQSATLPGGFTVLVGPRVSAVTTNVAFQGELIGILGSGFQEGFRLLLDEREVTQSLVSSSTLIEALVPVDLPAGLYDVTVLGAGRSSTLTNALLVREPADVAVTSLTVTRPHLQTGAVSIPLEILDGQAIKAVVRNLGSVAAENVTVTFTVREDEESPDLDDRPPVDRLFNVPETPPTVLTPVVIPRLGPGESHEVRATWRTSTVGDHVVRAEVAPTEGELALGNNAREERTHFILSGVRAFDHCDIISGPFGQCHVVYNKRITTSETKATDTHKAATASFDLRMRTPRFEFDGTDRIVHSSTTRPDGTITDCTVWRFFGGRGTMMVSMEAGDGIDGSLEVPTAVNRTSSGTSNISTTISLHVWNVEIGDPRSPSGRREIPPESKPTQPRDSYEYLPPDWKTLHVEGAGLKGDFTRCTVFSPEGQRTERFVYAALPSNLEQHEPSFHGVGTVQTLKVRYLISSQTTTNTPLRPPPVGDPL